LYFISVYQKRLASRIGAFCVARVVCQLGYCTA
jgi:hypothetical protein